MGLRTLAVAILAAASVCTVTAQTEEANPIVLKVRLLFRDPEARQPKWDCPTGMICLRYPNSFTVDVLDVMAGDHVPRRAHAILWFHTFPKKGTELLIAGERLASGDIDAHEWDWFEYSGCPPGESRPPGLTKTIQELQLAERLPCKLDH